MVWDRNNSSTLHNIWAILSKMGYELKRDPNKVRGDTIEVKLRDVNLNTFYRSDMVHINDKKKMLELLKILDEKGVTFHKSWFD